ncbi:MAG: hypothetical protein EBT83_11375 [Betaproteobacteria bacterium]|nr:hypothetical protein [Betaproteobacteria bacterium]
MAAASAGAPSRRCHAGSCASAFCMAEASARSGLFCDANCSSHALRAPTSIASMAAVTTAVLSGEVPIMFSNLISTMPQVQAGRLRALGITGPARLPAAPEIPTIAESGLPGYEVTGWYGIMAPANTPADIVNRLGAAIAKSLQSPEVLRRFAGEGIDPVGSTPEAFGKLVHADLVKWAEVVRISGARVD